MKLESLFQKYPNFRLATQADNQEILSFFQSMTMDTPAFSLRYERGPDFFAFTKEQGLQNFTFVIVDEDKKIMGTASITVMNHILNFKKKKIAYLGDLRISPRLNAKIRILWKKFYSELIDQFHSFDEFTGIEFLYSAILEENENAIRSLLKNNDKLIYHQLTSYNTYNIYAKKFLAKLSDKYIFESVTKENFLQTLNKFSQLNGLQENFNLEEDNEFNRRIKNWDNFSEKNLFYIKDENGQVLATFAPWMPTSKKLVVQKMSTKFKILGKVLPLIGIPSFSEGKPVNVLYITHLNFNPELPAFKISNIISAIINYLLKTPNRNFHTISFFAFPEMQINDLPFYYEKTPARFFQVMSKTESDNGQFINLNNRYPAFEIGTA